MFAFICKITARLFSSWIGDDTSPEYSRLDRMDGMTATTSDDEVAS